MGWKMAQYSSVRSQMRPGDVIAFSGKGDFSEIIKWATRAEVSHVGVVVQSKLYTDGQCEGEMQNQLVESTLSNGFSGVLLNWLSARLDSYDGEVWWLPLRRGSKPSMDINMFVKFILGQLGRPYDLPQAIRSAMDQLDNVPLIRALTYNKEDFAKFFCSELVAAGLEAGGLIKNVNSSEVTPIDLCMFNIFEDDYYQLKGDRKDIRGFNSLDPTGWGE